MSKDLLYFIEQGDIVNIALNKPVTMSSLKYDWYGNRAVDGITDGLLVECDDLLNIM